MEHFVKLHYDIGTNEKSNNNLKFPVREIEESFIDS